MPTNGEKTTNPIIPEEPEIRKEAGNQLSGVEDVESLTSVIDSITSPLIINRDPIGCEDEFETTDYGEGTIDCALPLHPEDGQRHRVQYLDGKLNIKSRVQGAGGVQGELVMLRVYVEL